MIELLSLTTVLMVATAPAGTACEDATELMDRFTAVDTIHASYVEHKHIQLMEKPLVSRGELVLIKPDRLRMDMLDPVRQTVLVTRDRVRIIQHDLGAEQELDLGSHAEARTIVGNVLLAMGGQVEQLVDEYSCALHRTDDGGYRMDLTPSRPPMNRMIQSLEVVFDAELVLRQVTIVEVGGDHSVLAFEGVEYDRPLSDAEQEAIFAP